MKKRFSEKVSQGWIVLGIIGILTGFIAWIREGFGITSGADWSYLIMIGFFIFATFAGIGAKENKLWGKLLLTVTSVLLLLYCFMFLGHIWTSFGVIWFCIVLTLCVFAVVTIPMVWIKSLSQHLPGEDGVKIAVFRKRL